VLRLAEGFAGEVVARQKNQAWMEVRALIMNSRREYLICLPRTSEDESRWEFPGGMARENEGPEQALRRCCREQLGVDLEITLGQPPFVHNFGGKSITYRYFVCGVRKGAPEPLGCAEVRWVLAGQLRDYEFDRPTQDVVDWILEAPPG